MSSNKNFYNPNETNNHTRKLNATRSAFYLPLKFDKTNNDTLSLG
jgi:hypothetical protein